MEITNQQFYSRIIVITVFQAIQQLSLTKENTNQLQLNRVPEQTNFTRMNRKLLEENYWEFPEIGWKMNS